MKLYISETYIIKGADCGVFISGFDLLTEKFVKVRNDECNELPESVVSLLSNERARAIIALEISDYVVRKTAPKLNITERTLHRIINSYGIYEKDKKGFAKNKRSNPSVLNLKN